MHLISLVGEQPIPNLIPLLMAPDQYQAIRFAVSEFTLETAENLTAYIKDDAVLKHIEILPPIHLPPYHVEKARDRITDELYRIHADGGKSEINITGGTKLMSLAAVYSALNMNAQLMYISTQTNEIINLNESGEELKRTPIRVNISAEQYFKAHGIETSFNQNFNKKQIRPAAPEKEGDALELQVEKLALDSGFFDDVQRSLHIRRTVQRRTDEINARNELDIVVTLNGRMAVCSCKSGKNVNNDDVYEIASLSNREQFGIYCGKVLVSQEPVRKGIVAQAASMGVQIVHDEKINQVADVLLKACGGSKNRKEIQ